MTDLNDLSQRGELPAGFKKKSEPANRRAQKVAEDRPKILSEQDLLAAGVGVATKPRDDRRPLTTTHWEIDRDTGGFRPKQVWFIAANSGFGKTSLTIACADEQIKAGRRPLIVTAEDPEELYGERLLMRRTRVDRYRFSQGRLNAVELSECMRIASEASTQPLYLEAIGKTVEWAAKQVAALIASEGVDMVYFDYVQAFDTEQNFHGDELKKVKHVGRTVANCIKSNGISGAALSQITQDDSKPVPKKEMMRYCKDLGIMAEVVAMGFEAKADIPRKIGKDRVVTIAEEGDRCILIDKNKPGPGPFSGRIYKMGSDDIHGCFDAVPSPHAANDAYFDDAARPLDASNIPWNETDRDQ